MTLRKNVASQFLTWCLTKAADNTALTGATCTVVRSIDGAAQTAVTGTVSELGGGQYSLALSAADTNGNDIGYLITASTAKPQVIQVYTTAADPTDSVRLGLTALPNAAAAAANGLLINGSNTGTVTLAALTVTGVTTHTGATVHTGNVSMAAGLNITQSSANTSALVITGTGTGNGITTTGGTTGAGMSFVGGPTSGFGITITTTSGDGISVTPTAGHAIVATANGTSKHGIQATGGTAGTSDGVKAVAGTGGVGMRLDTLTSTGAVSFASTFGVAGTTTFNALTVTNATTLSGAVSLGSSLTTAGTVTFNAFTVTNATTLTGAVSLGSTLGVTGTTTLAAVTTTGTVTMNAMTVTNATTHSGAVVFGSTWGVTGAVTLSSTLAVTGGTTSALTGNITGNLSGSVGSVTGGVGGNLTGNVGGNVTGSVGSVVGAVGSVTGNVGGNVSGSVASVVGAVGSVTGNVGGNITGTVASVVGNVGGNVTGSVGSVVGAVGSVTGAVASVTGNVGGNVTGNVSGNVTGSVGSVAAGGITAASIADGAIDRATFAADTGLLTIRSGTAQAGTTTSITLDGAASAVTDFYKYAVVYTTGGTGVGQYALITAYNGTTKVASTTPTFRTAPDNTTTFAVLPQGAVDLETVLGVALNTGASSGYLPADTIKLAGTTNTARDIGASVLLSSGTGTGQLDFTSGVVKANATQWLGGTIPAVNVTGVPLVDLKYTLGTISPATAGSVRADAVTGAVGSVTGAVGSVTGAVGSVTGSVGSIASGGIASASFASGATIPRATLVDTVTTYTGNTVQTGDSYSRLGAPVGASISADIAAVKADTSAIKVKTDFLPSATAGSAGGVFIAGSNASLTVAGATVFHAVTTGAVIYDSLLVTNDVVFGHDFSVNNNVGVDGEFTVGGDFSATGQIHAIGGFLGNITGNLSGSVGSVAGSVGSVTGNVAGNVSGTVGGLAAIPAGIRAAKNVALSGFTFPMYLTGTSTPATGKTVTATRSIDGAAFASCANSVSEVSNGIYKINLAAADLNGGTVTLRFVATGCDDSFATLLTSGT